MAVCAETVHDPHANYTILGRIVTINLDEYDTHYDAAVEAARRATDAMPEDGEEILDSSLRVFTLFDREDPTVPVTLAQEDTL
jgi:hypothetical protein